MKNVADFQQRKRAEADARVAAIALAREIFGEHVMDYREHSYAHCVSIHLGRGLRGDIYGRGRSIEGARRAMMRILRGLKEQRA